MSQSRGLLRTKIEALLIPVMGALRARFQMETLNDYINFDNPKKPGW